MKKNHLSWKIGGEAGFGIMSAGEMFGRALVRSGLFVFGTTDYPSLIRGGHNTYYIRAEPRPVFTHIRPLDILVALNEDTIARHIGELWTQGLILYDPQTVKDIAKYNRSDVKFIPVPLTKLAKDAGGEFLRNTAALGATLGLFGHPADCLLGLIVDMFGKKGPKMVKMNADAVTLGIEYVTNNVSERVDHALSLMCDKQKMYVTGNDAMCLGAIKAGCSFFTGYPMSPASSILTYMAEKARQCGFVVEQTEDEISAINMAIGASHAGARSMTATSGGGFALMVEALGLAGMTETPIVIVEVQRPGPSTGIPTYTEQGDLRFMMHASQGDVPRCIIAPGDAEECFYLTAQAHNIAEKYQMPVIVLADKFLSGSHFTLDKFDESKIIIDRGRLVKESELISNSDYMRYDDAEDGISQRSLPGTKGGVFRTTGNEHTEYGNISDESANRIVMMHKRQRKLDKLKTRLFAPILHGVKEAPLTIVGWGSTKHPILEAIRLVKLNFSLDVNFLQIMYVLPFPTEALTQQLKTAKKLLMVENNFSAQMRGVIREYTGINIENTLLKFDGRMFYPEEIVERVMGMLREMPK